MWRIWNSITRGIIRKKTPAPSSQTAPWSDESDAAGSAPTSSECLDEVTQAPSEVSRLQHHLPQSEDVKAITQRILNSPSEADILLREFFGPEWKNCENRKRFNETGRCGSIPSHIVSGLGLGTAAILVGRSVFSFWRTRQPRFHVSCDGGVCSHSKTGRFDPQKSRTSRLRVLPDTLRVSTTVLAAGSDTGSKVSQAHTPVDQQRLDPVQSIAKRLPKDKSVTFEEDSSEDSASASTRGSISEEALERFAEDAKGCCGATYCILGLKSVKAGNYKEAFQTFRLAAAEGYHKAYFNLGLCYMKGLGTKKDIAKAKNSFERAAYKGHTKAQYNLALLLLESESTVERIRAVRLLETAASNGFLPAQSFLGVYLTRPGESQDMKKAAKMFKMAAGQGDPASKYHLGICYERGLGGLRQDLLMAFDLFSAAASCEHLDAKYQMAVMIDAGFTGVERNPRLGLELLTAAAKAGHRPSARLLEEKGAAARRNSTSEMRINRGKVGPLQSTTLAATEPVCAESEFGANQQIMRLVRKSVLAGDGNLMSGNGKTTPVTLPNMLSRHVGITRALAGADTGLNVVHRVQGYRRPHSDLQSEFSDALSDFLRLPRPATTPDLCCRSPAIKEASAAFSLEV